MKNVKVIFDRRKMAEKKGTGFIDICVYLKEGERKFEIVGSSTPDEWEAVAQRNGVYGKVKYYENVINAMRILGEDMTITNFNKHICASNKKEAEPADNKHLYKETDQRQSFTDFIETYLNKEGLRSGSRRNIQVVIDSLKEFKIIKTFNDLTPVNIRKYDEWLHEKGDKSMATIYNYHKKVHKYTKILWRSEMIPSDPYNHVQFNRGSNKEREPLTEDELLILRNAELSDKLTRVRDLFIFMAYTGVAYADMRKFNFDTDTEKQGKTYYINSSRVKTGSKYYSPILPPAQAVLEKYNYKLPVITNQKLNDYLDVIKEELHFHKKITCHVARHSFATLMLSYGVPMENTQRMLGHKDIKTTQIYGKILKKNVEDRVVKIIKKLK